MRRLITVISVLLFVLVFSLDVLATNGDIPEGYGDLEDALPEDVRNMLPADFFSQEIDKASDAVGKTASPAFWLRSLWNFLCGGIESTLGTFAILVAMLALGAILSSFSEGSVSKSLKGVIALASSICFSATIVGIQLPVLKAAADYFERVCAAMNSLIPVMVALYLSGGNAGGAALADSSLLLQINLIEIGATFIVMPAVSACMALTLADSLKSGESFGFAGMVGFIKRSIAFVLGLCSTLLMASLSAQNILSAAADGMSVRAVKFVAGNMIPVVGNTVGETLRTLAASVRVLRGTVGIAGICVIALLMLPFIAKMLLMRFAFGAAASVGELMGRRSEVKLCREISSLYGYIIAAAAMAAVLCIISLTLFAITSSAFAAAV